MIKVEPYISQLLVFSGGGLISIVQFKDSTAEIWVNWPESVALKSMKLVADILNLYQKTKRRVVHHGLWVAYVPENSDYIIMAKLRDRKYVLPTVGLIRKIINKMGDIPEESHLVGETIVDIFMDHFNVRVQKVIRKVQ